MYAVEILRFPAVLQEHLVGVLMLQACSFLGLERGGEVEGCNEPTAFWIATWNWMQRHCCPPAGQAPSRAPQCCPWVGWVPSATSEEFPQDDNQLLFFSSCAWLLWKLCCEFHSYRGRGVVYFPLPSAAVSSTREPMAQLVPSALRAAPPPTCPHLSGAFNWRRNKRRYVLSIRRWLSQWGDHILVLDLIC